LATIGDHHFALGLATSGPTRLDLFHQIHARGDFAENDVLAVQPGSHDRADEELRTVRVRASIGHGEDARLGVLQGEVLVGKLLAVNGFTTGAIAAREVATLDHEVRDDSVELAALKTESLFARAEGAEVLGRLGDDIGEERELNATSRRAADGNVEVNLGVRHCRRWVPEDAAENVRDPIRLKGKCKF